MDPMITIVPHVGIDLDGRPGIRFGMTRAEVERAMGRTPKRAKRNPFALNEHDYFENPGFFVYYDADDRAGAIEFTRDARVAYDGFELFAHPATEVRTWARQRDQDLDDKHGFTSKPLGLGMWAEWIDEPDVLDEERDAPAMSFSICRPGFSEEERERSETAFGGLSLDEKLDLFTKGLSSP
jgi:hypothetical protein